MHKISKIIENISLPVADLQLASHIFIKLLAITYLIAFASLSTQITGLVGTNGILPFGEFLTHISIKLSWQAYFFVPSIFWLSTSDIFLLSATYVGCILSVALLLGFKRKFSLIILFILYLSLFHAGQTFLTFQWDSLLLECGFLAIFLNNVPSKLIIFLYHWLLFRLRFMSGIVKLSSGDSSWANLTTLNYYFETQPLPHFMSWYFHQLPEWLLKIGVLFVFFSELIVPFFIFLPRRFRLIAASITIFIQLLIIATSNHNWINLLTIFLCVFLLDDHILKRILPTKWQPKDLITGETKQGYSKLILPAITLIIVMVSVLSFSPMITNKNLPDLIDKTTVLVRSWGIGHSFHVFPNMQTERHELQVEGSYDGLNWQAYEFKYKPGPLSEMPEFIVPHQPRLDWMMWFVPTQHPPFVFWFQKFLLRLKQGSPEVTKLLAGNPFEKLPPRYLRVQVFKYQFTAPEKKAQTGQWWDYQYLGEFPYVKPRRP